MKIFDYFKWPFQGFFKGINSYRFFNALSKSKTEKVLKMIKKRRDLFKLEEIYTSLSPLHVLIRENNTDLLPAIFERKDIKNYIDSQENVLKWAPVHFAASTGSISVLDSLCKFHPNLSLKNSEGSSAIHIAAGRGHKLFIEQLLHLGVHTEEKDINEWTALHYASAQNYKEVAEFLLSKGARTSACDKNGLTPLFAAILHGNQEIVEFLYNFKDGHKGTSPLRPVHLASGLLESKVLEWLHSQGEDIWQLDNSV